MKKLLFLVTAFFALTASEAVKAEEGFYVGILGGGNWAEVSHLDLDTGYIFAGSLGYKFCNDFRVDAEIGYRRNQLRHFHFDGESFRSHGHLQTWTYMAHVYYDLPLDLFCYFDPFIGAGIGYANRRFNDSGFDHDRDNGFAWDLIAGIAFPVTCNIEMDVEYRYLHTRGQHHHNSSHDNSFAAALRYMF